MATYSPPSDHTPSFTDTPDEFPVSESLPSTLSLPLHHLTPSSVPNSPHLGHRQPSGGKIVGGFKRMFRAPPTSQSSFDRGPPLSATAEEPYHSSEGTPIPKVKSYRRLRPVRIPGTFRRSKRRSDKQYHSDDGYTSDPGLPLRDDPLPSADMEEDEETDGADSSEGHGQGVESRLERQRKMLERKIEKKRQQLEEEAGNYHENQTVYLQGLESTMSDKAQQKIQSRFHRNRMRSQAIMEQNRKKLEKYEKDLTSLHEGGAKEGLRGKIEGGLRGSLTGIKKGFSYAGNTLKKGKRYIVRTRTSQGGEVEGEDGEEVVIEEEDEEEEEEEEEEEVGSQSESMLVMRTDVVTVAKSPDDILRDQQKQLRRELEEEKARVSTLEEVVHELVDSLQQAKDTTERLEGQVNDVIDLHQNAVGELRGQLAQMESMTVGKSQDLEDAVEEYQSKVEKLDTLLHMEIERKAEVERARNCMMTVMVRVVTFALQAVALIAKLISVLSTKTGAISAVVVVLVAILLYFFVWTNYSS